jgi:hypothetical protein
VCTAVVVCCGGAAGASAATKDADSGDFALKLERVLTEGDVSFPYPANNLIDDKDGDGVPRL